MKYLLTFTVVGNDTLAEYMSYYCAYLEQPVHHWFSTLKSLRNFLKYYQGQYKDVIKWKISA